MQIPKIFKKTNKPLIIAKMLTEQIMQESDERGKVSRLPKK